MLRSYLLLILSMLFALALPAQEPTAAPDTNVYPIAILPFSERGPGMEGQGQNVADILFAGLIASPNLYLVERQDLRKITSEHEINLSGAVSSGSAIQIGQLTGAKILITGSVFKAGVNTYIVAKIMSTETSKLLGQSVKGTESINVLAEELSASLAELMNEKAATLVAPPLNPEQRVEELRRQLGNKSLPTAWVEIKETHIARQTIDPAAETEFILLYRELGGTVLDATADPDTATYRVIGEGFSEFATRVNNLVSVKARLEVKVLNAAGEVVAIDRQTTVKVDLNEIGAGKAALQEASARLAERLLPKLAR